MMVVDALVVELPLVVHGGPVVLPGSHCLWAGVEAHRATTSTKAMSSCFTVCTPIKRCSSD